MPDKKLTLGRPYAWIAALLCVAFLLCSTFFVFYMIRRNQAESQQYLESAAAQTVTALDKQLSGDLQTLEGIAICLGDAGVSDPEQLARLLQKINDNNAFLRMGFAYPDGSLELLDIGGDPSRSNVAGYAFFRSALEGSYSVSETLPDSLVSGAYINYFGAPVWAQDGTLVGVLCAVGSTDILREIIDAHPLNGAGFYNVVGPDGTLVIRSIHSDLSEAFQLETPDPDYVSIDPAELARMTAAFHSGETVSFEYRLHGQAQLAVLSHLESTDWTLFTSVPASALRQRYIVTALGCCIIIAVACFIFLLLFYQQRRLTAKSQQSLAHLAYDDPLTGCWNYARFLDQAPSLLQEKVQDHWAVWYCDLKKFKYLNDVFGYHVGDQVLRDMARWLEACTAGRGAFCRVSSDHFSGLVSYGAAAELESWFARLLSLIREDDGTELYAEFSMGFYCITQEDLKEGVPLNTMVNRANMAQRSAKELPGSRCALFTEALRRQSQLDAELEAAGRAALKNGEFHVYFQPKVDIQHGDVLAGAEALVRWIHPQKGRIPPDRFIPLFEENGMIVDLDRYMFRRVCQWFRDYLAQGLPRVNVAVNVSRLGLLQEDFIGHYAAVKEEFGIPDGLIELEFTESVFLGDEDDRFLSTVQRLQAQGFICSLDDFGSGYSSLNLLKNLPIDVLKLDILFFRSGTDIRRERTVVSNVVNMARELNIRTVAEGVEDRETVEFLRGTGCDMIQGFIFAKPMPCEDFDRLLREREGAPMPMDGDRAADR